MHRTLRLYSSSWVTLCFLTVLSTAASTRAADFGPGFKTQSVPVDGGTVSVTVGGSGPPVVLLHGYAESSRMWKPLAKVLAPRFTVIAPDLPGIGDSSIPKTGIDMKTSAERIHAAVRSLGYSKVRVVGHDIGLMVAYAYAAMYPQEVEKLALMDAFLPGVGGWEAVYNNPGIWHFRFYGATPEALVKGRERIYSGTISQPTRPARFPKRIGARTRRPIPGQAEWPPALRISRRSRRPQRISRSWPGPSLPCLSSRSAGPRRMVLRLAHKRNSSPRM